MQHLDNFNSEHKFRGKFKNLSLLPIQLTTVLNSSCADKEKMYLAESGVTGRMDMLVLGKQLSFTGALVSPYDFLIDINDFVSQAIKL